MCRLRKYEHDIHTNVSKYAAVWAPALTNVDHMSLFKLHAICHALHATKVLFRNYTQMNRPARSQSNVCMSLRTWRTASIFMICAFDNLCKHETINTEHIKTTPKINSL